MGRKAPLSDQGLECNDEHPMRTDDYLMADQGEANATDGIRRLYWQLN